MDGRPDGSVVWGNTASTRTGGAFVMLGLALGPLGFLTGNRLLLAVGVGAFALTILAHVSLRRDVPAVMTTAPRAVGTVGSELTQHLVLHADGPVGALRCQVVSRAAPAGPVRLGAVAAPGGAAEVVVRRHAVRRGSENVLSAVVERRDPLGLALRRGTVVVDGELLVHPRAVAVELPPIPAPSTGRRGEEPPEPGVLRPWRTGDSTRRVSWRASARSGSLLVRDDERVAEPPAVLLVLAAADGEDDLDPAVELAVAAALAGLPRQDLMVHIGLAAAHGHDRIDGPLLLDLYARARPTDAVSAAALPRSLEQDRPDAPPEVWVAVTPRAAVALAPYDGVRCGRTVVRLLRPWGGT